MGVLNYSDPNGPVQIRELYFGAPQLSGLYMLFLVVCTLNEKLYYTFSFPEPLLSRQSAAQIADTFSAELQAAC
jgi:hypothetical protein